MSHHDICCQGLRVGQKVHDFTAATYNPEEGGFEEITLSKLLEKKKWVILFFYPADFTFVCPTELADLAEQHKALKDMGVEVISVSTDTKFAHLAWRTTERLLEGVRFQMAADPTGKLARLFGVYDEEEGIALRGTFIINPDGILVGSEVNFYNVGRNAAELKRKMEANVYLREHPAEACPARWEKGKKTLTPSEKIVGNVYQVYDGSMVD